MPYCANYQPVKRLDKPSKRAFYRECIAPLKPAIITGMIEHWPAFKKWNPDYFRKHYGQVTVPVEIGGLASEKWKHQEMTLEAYLTLLQTEPDPSQYYLSQYTFFQEYPELKQDVGVPIYRSRFFYEPAKFWFGPTGSYTPVHWDIPINLLCLIYGKKQILLFPPEQSAHLYPYSKDSGHQYRFSPVDVKNPDLEKYPQFRETEPFEAVLSPGEMLFIPTRWWHYTYSLELNIAVNFWWFTTKMAIERYVRHRLLQKIHTFEARMNPETSKISENRSKEETFPR